MKIRYKVRHAILDVFYQHRLTFPEGTPMVDTRLTWDEVCRRLRHFDEEAVWQGLEYLTHADEIHCSLGGRKSLFGMLTNGTEALHTKKYLEQGAREFREVAFEWIKIVSTIVLLGIAVATFVVNTFQTIKNTKQVERLNGALNELRHRVDGIEHTDSVK